MSRKTASGTAPAKPIAPFGSYTSPYCRRPSRCLPEILLRERAGQRFLPDVRDLDRFCLINTALDTAVNLFMLEKDGVTPERSPYLARQQARIEMCLQTLEADLATRDPAPVPGDDVGIRLACFLEWSQFRRRVSLEAHPVLSRILAESREHEHFVATLPQE